MQALQFYENRSGVGDMRIMPRQKPFAEQLEGAFDDGRVHVLIV
jgi:hypothetical protein